MKEDAIRQVKDAENRAEEKTHEAQVQADKILHDARHKTVELHSEILNAARAKAKDMFEAGSKKFEPKLENVHQTFKQDVAKDSEQAQKNIDTVVDFVVAKFQERLGT